MPVLYSGRDHTAVRVKADRNRRITGMADDRGALNGSRKIILLTILRGNELTIYSNVAGGDEGELYNRQSSLTGNLQKRR